MKRVCQAILLSMLCFVPLRTMTADRSAVLLTGSVHRADGQTTTVTGTARAIIKRAGEQTTVTAREIAFDAGRNALVCVGDVIVSAADSTFKVQELSIELGSTAAPTARVETRRRADARREAWL